MRARRRGFLVRYGVSKINKMKAVSINLLFILISVACFAKTESKIDSLIQAIIEQPKIEVEEPDLLGQWSKYEGFDTKHIIFKEENMFSYSTTKCMGERKGPTGKWTVNKSGIELWVKGRKEQIYLANIESQVCLWTEEEIRRVRALTTDFMRMGELKTIDELAVFITKTLKASTYKKTAP
jgi:hypothetical protein